MKILDKITDYRELKKMSYESLQLLAGEIREKIIEVVSVNGGHLGSPLGAVELTIALLRQFDPESDRIIFDVGHQCYPYKILTGRLEEFGTLRRMGGMSGFPKRTESRYDHFDVGHSSTSISAALGFAKARDLRGEKNEVVAIIGDGALLNGLAFEALNYCSECNSKVIIVLNDNHMCISPRIGGFATYLARLSSNYTYRNLKNLVKKTSHKLPKGKRIASLLKGTKEKLKSVVKPENIFDEMGINYWGPFDGHNLEEVDEVFGLAKKYDKPVLIHLLTKKGKGNRKAEDEPWIYHGVSPSKKGKDGISWSAAVAGVVEEIAGQDDRVTCLTAAMKEGNKLVSFAEKYPERFLDVGIAEEHMLTMSAGMAAAGLRPFVFIYSTFMQRAMDQLVHDIAMQNLPVVVAVDRAGLIGEDGETHQGLLDLAWTRSIPNIEVMSPRDIVDLELMMYYGYERNGPTVIRFPRGEASRRISRQGQDPTEYDLKAEILQEGSKWALLGVGKTVEFAMGVSKTAEEKGFPLPTVVDIRNIKPLDWDTLDGVIANHGLVLTIEDGYVTGGFGEGISTRAAKMGCCCVVENIGVPDLFVPHGTMEEQWQICGITHDNVLELYDEYQKSKA